MSKHTAHDQQTWASVGYYLPDHLAQSQAGFAEAKAAVRGHAVIDEVIWIWIVEKIARARCIWLALFAARTHSWRQR